MPMGLRPTRPGSEALVVAGAWAFTGVAGWLGGQCKRRKDPEKANTWAPHVRERMGQRLGQVHPCRDS